MNEMNDVTPEDWQKLLGELHEITHDDEIIKILKKYPELEPLIIGISHMIRTSNLDDKTIKQMKIRWRIAIRLQLKDFANSHSEDGVNTVALFQLLTNYGYAAIEDARNGHRARMLTERIKILKFENTKKPRNKLWGIF
jgi:hypothetical protein